MNLYFNKFSIFNLSFVLYSFLVVVFGTFFLRSGNLDSIHNFVVEFSRGYALIFFIFIILVACVSVFFFVQSNWLKALPLKADSLLVNTFLCVTILYILFIYSGTFFPFFYKIFFGEGVWVATSFYNIISLYYFAFVLFLYFMFFFKGLSYSIFWWFGAFLSVGFFVELPIQFLLLLYVGGLLVY